MELKVVYSLLVLFLNPNGEDELHHVKDYVLKSMCLDRAKVVQGILNKQFKQSDAKAQTLCIGRAKFKLQGPKPYDSPGLKGETPGA